MDLLLCGASFELSRKHARVTERWLQKRISLFNDGCIDAVTYHPVSGRPGVLTDEAIEAEILPVLDDPHRAREHHWTVTKLCGWLREEKVFGKGPKDEMHRRREQRNQEES